MLVNGKERPPMYCAGSCGKVIAYGTHKVPHFCEACGNDPEKNKPAAKKKTIEERLNEIEADVLSGKPIEYCFKDLLTIVKEKL